MSLKRTGEGRQIAGLLLAMLLLFTVEGIVVWHLVTAARWDSAFLLFVFLGLPFVFVILLIDWLMLVSLAVLILRSRVLRAAANSDNTLVPLAKVQPDPQLVLKGGETLTLERRKRRKLRGILSAALGVIVFGSLGELCVLAVLPSLNPLYAVFAPFDAPPPPAPSPLDWLCAAFPVVLCVVLLASLVASGFSGRRERITADDLGITIERSRLLRRRRRHIPWNDILLFLSAFGMSAASSAGGYTLWGRDHFVGLTIHERKTVAPMPGSLPSTQAPDSPGEAEYQYTGGYDAYLERGRRLLATIAVRSGQPLRVSQKATGLLSFMQRRFPSIAVDVEHALAAPETGMPWQPSPEAVAAAPPLGTRLTLQRRMAPVPTGIETLIWSVLLWLFISLWWNSSLISEFSIPKALSGDVALVAFFSICGLLVLVFGWLLAATRRQQSRPAVIADDAGLRVSSSSSAKQGVLPWAAIRAWVVVPPAAGSRRPPTYIVFSDAKRLSWTEPEDAKLGGRGVKGDRRAAYRERAAQLHAIIAARTGLPLRELRLAD